jgi:hypothetical protein
MKSIFVIFNVVEILNSVNILVLKNAMGKVIAMKFYVNKKLKFFVNVKLIPKILNVEI